MQQSHCYTQLSNYSKAFLWKPISNQVYIFVDFNVCFTRSLNGSYLEMDG